MSKVDSVKSVLFEVLMQVCSDEYEAGMELVAIVNAYNEIHNEDG